MMPTPMPPVTTVSNAPSACVLPPRQYTTASAIDASVLAAKHAAPTTSARARLRSPSSGIDDRRIARRGFGVSVATPTKWRARADPTDEREERPHTEEPRDESLGDR